MDNSVSEQKNTKLRILEAATNLFAIYGFHATTTRMIAKESGVDISTLHYHWGDKIDLFIETLLNMNEKNRQLHRIIEKKVRSVSLKERIETAVNTMVDFLFDNPDYASLSHQACFSNIRVENKKLLAVQNDSIDIIQDIAYFAFRLGADKNSVPRQEVLSIMGLVELANLYVNGESCFNRNLGYNSKAYRKSVKQVMIHMFSQMYDNNFSQ